MKNKISWNRLYRKIYIASDEVKDKERYDAVANEIISQPVHSLTKKFGLNGIPEIQLDIYKKYYDIANKSISPTMQVLELGSGIGIHSGVLAKNILGGRLFINDISKVSLEINNKVHPAAVTLNSSMECISLPNNSLDFVFSCAALSYGDPDLVDKEILRLLKVNGNLVILDEPTDGFSAQQLDKMRDVLNQLDVEQLIIVSHEQKIEGFVDNIIRISKDTGITKIDS
jgi:ubiquinone/menaquinone biosynthesis C-methylase UbiE